eukprot:CFRG7232T1
MTGADNNNSPIAVVATEAPTESPPSVDNASKNAEENKQDEKSEENTSDALVEKTEMMTIQGTSNKIRVGGKGVTAGKIDWAEEQARQLADKTSVIYSECRSFEELELPDNLLKGVYAMGFKQPSKIQGKAFPIILKEHKDLLAQSQSGTGKTAAFSLGMLAKVDETKKYPQALCLSPARELAKQTYDVCCSIGKYTETKVFLAVAGQRFDRSHRFEEQIMIGTPGTILGYMKNRNLDPKQVTMLVFDEADQMLDHGNMQDDSIRIRKQLAREHQTLLFSATFSERVMRFATKVCPEAVKITIRQEELALDGISQYAIKCPDGDSRYSVLQDIYGGISIGQVIIFVETKSTADKLHRRMTADGHSVTVLYGGNQQAKVRMEASDRDRVLDDFKTGRSKVLITTNVLARGIDIDQVNMVINYDLPIRYENNQRMGVDYETYLHRIGRTGRFGRRGVAITFVYNRESADNMEKLKKYFGKPVSELSSDDPEAFSEAFSI